MALAALALHWLVRIGIPVMAFDNPEYIGYIIYAYVICCNNQPLGGFHHSNDILKPDCKAIVHPFSGSPNSFHGLCWLNMAKDSPQKFGVPLYSNMLFQ